jgi:uncharacterized protein (DUF1501 family)
VVAFDQRVDALDGVPRDERGVSSRDTGAGADIETDAAVAMLSARDDDPAGWSRRQFLQLVGMGAGAGLVGGSLFDAVGGIGVGDQAAAWAAGPVGLNDGILVVVGMYGGNDGLNTVVPVTDGNYYGQHAQLAVPADQTLYLDSHSGLNPRLPRLKSLWDSGRLAIVEGVGQPDLDLSHFSSMATWMSGKVGAPPSSGWLGRWLDGELAGGADLYTAAAIGSAVPLHVLGLQRRATAVPPRRPAFGGGDAGWDRRAHDAIRAMSGTAGRGIWHEAAAAALRDQVDLATRLEPVLPAENQGDGFPVKMQAAARLINANVGFRVIEVGWGDFDSHANQPALQGIRLDEFNAGIGAFFDTLSPVFESRVAVMTFSEFGRTSYANESDGTDHGTSNSMFVMGANVRGGWYGQRPSLAGLGRWDRMAHHVDFRSYYASIIDGWLGGGSSGVLGAQFENLGLFERGPGIAEDGTTHLPPAVMTLPSVFVPLAPIRTIDTRDGTGGVARRPLNPEERLSVPVTGVGGVPDSGVTAVVANITSVEATQPMFFTAYPGSTKRPETSNINGGPGRPVPNLVIMGVGIDGCIEVYNSHGSTHCLVDVFGYFREGAGDRFNPVTPARLFDTRVGHGVPVGKIPAGTPVEIQVAGWAGVPLDGATAVVMNLTATEPESPGFLRLTPSGTAPVVTSNVNFFAWDTVPNLAICKLGEGGRITLDTAGQATHALGDVFGYFSDDGGRLRAMPPQRLLDTRYGVGTEQQPIGPDRTIRLEVAGHGQIPSNATAIVLNVAAMNAGTPSFVSVWPSGLPRPDTSNLTVWPGQTIANLVICQVGADGAVEIGNPVTTCDVLADALGFFVA